MLIDKVKKLLACGLALAGMCGAAPAVAGQSGVTVTRVDADLAPTPAARVWRAAPGYDVVLAAQQIAPPRGGGSVTKIRLQAVHNGRRIAFRLSWPDPGRDAEAAVDTFRDAVAIMFPVDGSRVAETSPLMGNRGHPVNIWQWRADWQAESGGEDRLAARQPLTDGVWISPLDRQVLKARYPGKPAANAAVVEYVAEGWGTLTRRPRQTVRARGHHDGRGWSVVFVRDLDSRDQTDARFALNGDSAINVAVWNGSAGEVASMKSVSLTWIPLKFQ